MTDNPTASDMELSHRRGPDRPRSILDLRVPQSTFIHRGRGYITHTPGADPPEVVTPSPRDISQRLLDRFRDTETPAEEGMGGHSVTGFSDHLTETVTFGQNDVMEDAWHDTPDHLVVRPGRNLRTNIQSDGIDGGLLSERPRQNRYDMLQDDEHEDGTNAPFDEAPDVVGTTVAPQPTRSIPNPARF